MNKSIRAALVAALSVSAVAAVAPALAEDDRGDDGWSWQDSMRGCASGSGDSQRHSSLQMVGLTGDAQQRLVCFNERRPGEAVNIGAVSGLVGSDTRLIGIDFRVQDGLLYGVGNAGGLYRISTTTAIATSVGALKVALTGTNFGVDFNPAANALRIVSDTGQNLRQPFGNLGNPTNAPLADTVADTALNTGGATPAPVLGVSGAAYTNNDLSAATATTLFDLNSTADNVQIQSPANSGILVPTGSLGVDAAGDTGFDIYSKLSNGVTVELKTYATLKAGGVTRLYKVNLLTGAAEAKGSFSSSNQTVIDIAIPLNQL